MNDTIVTSKDIADYRARRGWSQKRLADELRISQVAVHRYETGWRIPGPTQQLLRIWIDRYQPNDPEVTPHEPHEA